MGFVKSASLPSLGAGLAFGAILGYGAYRKYLEIKKEWRYCISWRIFSVHLIFLLEFKVYKINGHLENKCTLQQNWMSFQKLNDTSDIWNAITVVTVTKTFELSLKLSTYTLLCTKNTLTITVPFLKSK